jgi:hypothetical protein
MGQNVPAFLAQMYALFAFMLCKFNFIHAFFLHIWPIGNQTINLRVVWSYKMQSVNIRVLYVHTQKNTTKHVALRL